MRWCWSDRQLDPGAAASGLEDIEQAVAGNEAADDKGTRRPHERAATSAASIAALPAHLPRVDVTITPEDTNRPCCAPMM